jgi:hypothetical protein
MQKSFHERPERTAAVLDDSGTLYPIMLRLETAGWFVSRREAVDPAHVGRPRRRLYRLTGGAADSARSAPPALTERLEEEWSADLAARTGTLSRLRLAIGCWWATGVITREFVVPQVATSGAGGPVRSLLGEAHFDFPLLSRRSVTFVAIAGLHLLLIYGIASGLAQHVAKSLPPCYRWLKGAA